jgi:hypothetical protein
MFGPPSQLSELITPWQPSLASVSTRSLVGSGDDDLRSRGVAVRTPGHEDDDADDSGLPFPVPGDTCGQLSLPRLFALTTSTVDMQSPRLREEPPLPPSLTSTAFAAAIVYPSTMDDVSAALWS